MRRSACRSHVPTYDAVTWIQAEGKPDVIFVDETVKEFKTGRYIAAPSKKEKKWAIWTGRSEMNE